MADELFRWIDSSTGPYLLVPVECMSAWHGIEGWRDNGPDDPSDYARACRETEWVSVISCGDGIAAVLGGDVGPVAWKSTGTDRGLILQWIGCDSDLVVKAIIEDSALIERVLKADESPVMFETGPSGRLILFNSVESGLDRSEDRELVILTPGKYQIWSGYVERSDCRLVVRGLLPAISGRLEA